MNIEATKPKRRYKVKPTEKQIKAMELIRAGEHSTVAMKKAGYSEKTSRTPSQNLLGASAIQGLADQFIGAYLNLDVGIEYLAAKNVEWLHATKIQTSPTEPDQEVPDYQTQIKAGQLIREDMGLNRNINLTQNNFNFGDLKNKYSREG